MRSRKRHTYRRWLNPNRLATLRGGRHLLALMALGLIVFMAYAVFAATLLPGWVVTLSGSKADENHRLDAIANARGAQLGVLAPVVVAIGAVAAFLNYELNRKSLGKR